MTILDTNTPIIILFGPPVCGKTMMLLRLTRYLECIGYRVEPDYAFIAANDQYRKICDAYHQFCYNDKIPFYIPYLLVKVFDKAGRTICQILKVPGQYMFDPSYTPPPPFPKFLCDIMIGSYNRIWAFFLEPQWDNAIQRMNYVQRVSQITPSPNDKAFFIISKVDKLSMYRNVPKMKNNLKNWIDSQYPNIRQIWTNHNLFTQWFRPFNADFVPFSSGIFTETYDDRGVRYIMSHDIYPQMLWKCILKNIA